MGGPTQGELLSQTEILTAGLRSNLTKLKVRGIDEAFVVEIETLKNQISNQEAEQQALKSRLKEKTAQVSASMVTLKLKVSEAKKLIKLQIPQKGWSEFGISDVR